MTEDKNASLADGIFRDYDYSPEIPPKKEFLPWHRPRKQFVREKQWTNLINKLLDDRTEAPAVIKYLGLPGDDFLDIRYFHKHICERRNIQLQYLGFNNSSDAKMMSNTAIHISQDEVSKLQFIHSGSELSIDNITSLSKINSLAYSKSYSIGPFDVVNIDLCDGFGKHPTSGMDLTHYNALKNLFALQAKSKYPWLLFLTTRTNSECINDELIVKLKEIFNKNLEDCPDFVSASAEKFAVQNMAELEDTIKTPKGLTDFFLLGISKWMGALNLGQNPPTKVKVENVLSYKVEEAATHHDLTSIAIRFIPQMEGAADPFGIANGLPETVDECELALQFLNKIFGNKDVDKILADNTSVLNQMISDSCELLKQARYDVSQYEVWARNTKATMTLP